MTQFEDRIEGEIKTHEKEMIHKAVITKYGGKSLADRIQYVKSTYQKDQWSAEEMFAKLAELDLNGNDTLADILNALKNA